MRCLPSQALGGGGDHATAQLPRADSLGPTDLQADTQLQCGAIIVTLCKEEVLWDPALFIRHPGKLFGDVQSQLGDWRTSSSSREADDGEAQVPGRRNSLCKVPDPEGVSKAHCGHLSSSVWLSTNTP